MRSLRIIFPLGSHVSFLVAQQNLQPCLRSIRWPAHCRQMSFEDSRRIKPFSRQMALLPSSQTALRMGHCELRGRLENVSVDPLGSAPRRVTSRSWGQDGGRAAALCGRNVAPEWRHWTYSLQVITQGRTRSSATFTDIIGLWFEGNYHEYFWLHEVSSILISLVQILSSRRTCVSSDHVPQRTSQSRHSTSSTQHQDEIH